MPYLCTHLFSCCCQIHTFDTFRKYFRNATCPRYDTCKTTSLGPMTRVWDFTVATTSHARDSIVAMATQAWSKFHSITITMTARIWNGVTWMADWICDKLSWFAKWIWDELKWLTELTSNEITWMNGYIWDGVTWAGKPFTVEFNYVSDVAAGFYGEYMNSK